MCGPASAMSSGSRCVENGRAVVLPRRSPVSALQTITKVNFAFMHSKPKKIKGKSSFVTFGRTAPSVGPPDAWVFVLLSDVSGVSDLPTRR